MEDTCGAETLFVELTRRNTKKRWQRDKERRNREFDKQKSVSEGVKDKDGRKEGKRGVGIYMRSKARCCVVVYVNFCCKAGSRCWLLLNNGFVLN